MRNVIISTNSNRDYLYYLPLTVWCWKRFNWQPIVFYEGAIDEIFRLVYGYGFMELQNCFHVKVPTGYRSDTTIQTVRLYGACVVNEANLVMTADVDMLPLGDHWSPKENDLTIYNHDLTGFSEYAICYIAMMPKMWCKVMGITGNDYQEHLERDLRSMPSALSPDFYTYWGTDQKLVTHKINESGIMPVFHNRGQYSNGYARARADRGEWNINQPELIDAHLFQQLYFKQNENKFEMTMELLHKVWPKEDFTWWRLYTKEFQKLTGHA